MNRHVVAQALLFALISVVAIGYGIRYIGEDADVARGFGVVAHVEDARGVGPGVRVTYRGVDIGEVREAQLDGAGGVRLGLRIVDGTLIPVNAHARVVTSTALGDARLDVRPISDAGPYLGDGGELLVPGDEQPAALEDLIASIDTSLRALNPESLESLGGSVATALEGNGPRLGAILEDTARLTTVLGEQAPTFRGLVGDGLVTVRALAARPDPVTGSVSVARDVTGQLARRQDTLVYLLDHSPEAMDRAQVLLDANRENAAGLLGNTLVVTPVFRERGPAWEDGLTQGERGLRALAGTVRGGRADFQLVATQGPVCVYPYEPRDILDDSPRETDLRLYCPPGEDLGQRGSRAAPRPNDEGLVGATEPGTRIGPDAAVDPLLVPTGKEIAAYWATMMEGLRDDG
ncbi:MlaD family protein [Rhodococcus sp. IEGM 1408]|uniref:MlaD family protein n=1 Tax=Rhodococcus sp. IEGM 1408 TaxID=3082220 RepID=UPI002953FF38|nr:MlaD family protein [Rhodococcus sp. IEGM 1408]MDV8000016.1 MlaD family protein [Rhodococcus sp. IEGM 1408]